MHHLWNKSICDKQFIHTTQCNHFRSGNNICSCHRHYKHYNIHRSKSSSNRHSNNTSLSSASSLTLSQLRHHSVSRSHRERTHCTTRQQQQQPKRIRQNRFRFLLHSTVVTHHRHRQSSMGTPIRTPICASKTISWVEWTVSSISSLQSKKYLK